MSFNYKEIAEILKIIDASDCEEMILETDGIRLVVKRQGAARVEELSGKNELTSQQPQGARQQSAPNFKSATSLSEPEPEPKLEKRTDGCIEILAPMVGTLYLSPSPTEPVFVSEGDRVKPGQSLCLIEVMKLYTTIESTVTGRVKEIIVKEGALVSYNQVLFVLEPDAQK
jgi:acetyl-CoA carboxylase biotin carboxyl carrier protein